MKSKLLKKLRRRFADTHKVERERKTFRQGFRCSEYFRKC